MTWFRIIHLFLTVFNAPTRDNIIDIAHNIFNLKTIPSFKDVNIFDLPTFLEPCKFLLNLQPVIVPVFTRVVVVKC